MRRYSIKDQVLNVGMPGLITPRPIGGYANGDGVITFKRNSKSFETEVGADGHATVSQLADRSGLFQIKLKQTSPSNAHLASILQLQEAGAATFGACFVTATDLYRQDLAAGLFGVITGWPEDLGRGAKASDQTWEIFVEDLGLVLGAPTFLALLAAPSEAAG